jgi:farnesyl-diphosphate farnesyltransferase
VASESPDQRELLGDLLRGVSRSFYLTLRVLPPAIRPQIGVAYLLARTTDTIADTDVLPVEQRLTALEDLRRRILGMQSGPPSLGELAGRQASSSERCLLERVDEALKALEQFAPEDQRRVRDVLSIITSGQEKDLQRFNGASADRIIALATDAQLDDYTYRVAGCVGEFWTRMCVAHLFSTPKNERDPAAAANWFERSGVEFGKGLQLVNILRDLPRDLRNGRCYLPREALDKAGLSPAELLSPMQEARLRPVYDALLDRARGFLDAGWQYTCAIPRTFLRLRLACAWPLLIGVRTLDELRRKQVLDPNYRIKVSRSEVYGILLKTLVAAPFPPIWRRLGRLPRV